LEYSSLFFLYRVLPLIMLLYVLLPDVGRRNILLIFSGILLYALPQPVYALGLVALSFVTFHLAKKIQRGKRATVVLPIALNLGILLLLKYVDPVLQSAGIGREEGGILLGLWCKTLEAINGLGFSFQMPASIVPLGLSFYALSVISYLVDIYRGRYPAEKSFRSFLLYIFFFPKLFQGPIVRYDQMRLQLRERRESYRSVFEGAMRVMTGLAKKVLLADYCGRMINEMAATGSNLALVGSWLTAVLYLLRIYYDFSAACDIAIGFGRIFGFKLPENFNLPYTTMSVTEFFERWNLTLRSFIKDYVHDPLAGDSESPVRRFVVLLISVLVGALWHGGRFTFLVWGVYILAVMMIEKLAEEFVTDLPYWLRHLLTILVLLFGWVIFASPDVESLAVTLKAMIGDGGVGILGDGERVWNSLPLIGACWFGLTSFPRKIRIFIRSRCDMSGKHIPAGQQTYGRCAYLVACLGYMLVILWWITVSGVGSPVQPSIFMHL